MPQLNITIPEEMMDKLSERKDETGQAKSGIVKNAIAEKLGI
jgi:predicted DNA-binding protein